MAQEGSKDFVFNIKTKLDDSTKQALGAVDQIIQSLKGSAAQAEAALKAAVTQGLDPEPARQALEKLNSSLKALKGNKESLASGRDPLAAFEAQLDRAGQQADLLGSKIKIVQQRIVEMQAAGASSESVNAMQGQLRRLNEEQGRLNEGTQGTTRSYGQFRNSVQNASYQITDFMVQVQGGTSAVKALSQQGSQLLAGFGAWGAAAGLAVTGLTILWEIIQKMRGSSESLAKELGNLQSHMQVLAAEGKNFSLANMRRELQSTLGDVRELARAKLGAFQAESFQASAKAIDVMRASMRETRSDLEKGLGFKGKITPELIEFRKEFAAAAGDSSGQKLSALLTKYGKTWSTAGDDAAAGSKKLMAAAQGVVDAQNNVVKAGQTMGRGEIVSRQLELQTQLEGPLVAKMRERGMLQKELNAEQAKGARADQARMGLMQENLRLLDLSIQKDSESSSAMKERTKAIDHAAKASEIAARQHAALIASQNSQLESLRGGIDKVEAAAKRLRDIQKLREEMIKAGNGQGNSKIFEQLLADATDKLNTAKYQAQIDALQGVDKGYAMATEGLRKFSDQGKIDGEVMDGRIKKLHEIASASDDYAKALRANMAATGVKPENLDAYDQIALKLDSMREASERSKTALGELTLQFETGGMSLETYVALWQQLGGKMDDLATKNPTAYFDNLTQQFEDQKRKLEEMPIAFDAYAEKAKLSAATIEEMKNKFPQLSSESDKALTKLKSQLAGISMNALSDALSGNVKSWREWGANVLKQLGEVLIKWSLMQAAMVGAKSGAGTWWGSALGAIGGQSDAPGAGAPVINYMVAARGGVDAAPPPSIIDTSGSAVNDAVLNMRGNTANPGRQITSGTKVEVNNYANAQVETSSQTDGNGMETIRIMIREQVRESLSNGSMDSAMRMSYGLRRNPI